MKRTELARTASYATAPPGSRGPVKGVVPQGCGVQHRTLDGVAGGKIIAGVKRFDEECPLIFFASCLKPLTHSEPCHKHQAKGLGGPVNQPMRPEDWVYDDVFA